MKAAYTLLGTILTLVFIACGDKPRSVKHAIDEQNIEIDRIPDSLSKTKLCSAVDTLESEASYQFPPRTMISSAQFAPYTDIVYAGADFQLVINQENDTIYLATNDVKFVTPEGYKVGEKWKILAKLDKENIGRMSGWGYYIKLESGWQLGFCEGQSCTDTEPTSESQVKWIFRRNE
jgi:hypothetical protein